MDMKRFFLYAIVIAALTLAGCGGNGGGGMVDNGGNGGGETCPPGHSGSPPNCVPPPPPPPACSLGGAGIECGLTVAQPIADADKDGTFDTDLDTGRPNASVASVNSGARPLTVDGYKVTPTTGDPNQMKFEMDADASPHALSGHRASVHMRTMEADETNPMVVDTVTVYTDRTPAAATGYQKYYNNAATTGGNTLMGIDTIADDAKGNVITFGTDVSEIDMRFSGMYFPSGVNQTFSYMDDDLNTEDTDESEGHQGPRKFDGMFHGIPGEFSCPATGDCTAATDDDGDLMTLSAGWTFTPTTSGAAMQVAGVIPDADYLSFGYWVQATTEDGETTYGISTFHSGTAFPASDIAALEGTATYSGKATGLYVKKTFSADANDFTVNSSGQFTADAELTAHFGGDNVAVSLQDSINGTVTNFMDGNEMIDEHWTVTLQKADFDSTNNNQFSGNTTTGMGSSPGAWRGLFVGVPMKDGVAVTTDDATTMDVVENAPTGVVGEFNGHFSPGGGQNPGHVVGGFGARR